MSCYLQAQASAAVEPLRTSSMPVPWHRAVAWLRSCRQHRQERAELLSFMAADHRAAADIGITRYEAMNWSKQPFWRA